MKIVLSTILFVLTASAAGLAQTKPFEVAQHEISSFSTSTAFELYYDSEKYLTIAEIGFDALTEKDPLRKQFSKFDIQLTTYFAVKGIDNKPVRNTLCFISQSNKLQFSRESSLTISFSSSDVNFGEPNRKSEIKRGKAIETLCWETDKEIVEDFAEAAKIDFAVGNFKIKIPEDKLKIFKDYELLLTVENH